MPGNNYSKLVFIYDHLMRFVKYDKWAEYLCSLTKDYLPRDPVVLELACGNGKLASFLLKYYKNITITDKCFEMLNYSKNKLLQKICCDMTHLPFNNKFDFIFSTFDSINYLTSKKSLLMLFLEIRRVLNDKGIFTFDVSLERNSYKHIKIPIRRGSYNGVSYIQKTSYANSQKIHKNVFEIKLDSSEIYSEIHKQKIYPFEVYFELLEKAKLYVVECYNAFTFTKARGDMERVQFLVRKY
jgi:ubiquinone/menaquinone biosynthesis C-methylase UbiE